MSNASNIYGLDLSKNQGVEIDSLSPTVNNLAFIICKATDGLGYTDPDFKNNWTVAAGKGFVRGAYHFFRCADDPTQQAKDFLAAVENAGGFQAADLPPCIDVEEISVEKCPGQGAYNNVRENVLTWLAAVEAATGKKPLIYTDVNMAQTYLNDSRFAGYPLYIADYGTSTPAIAKTVWAKAGWVFWQQSGMHEIGKIENDYDAFNGDLKALQTFAAGV